MTEQIGNTAGRIWSYLNSNGKSTVSKLADELDENERAVLMGIGWLAREDKLAFSKQGRANYITLNRSGSL